MSSEQAGPVVHADGVTPCPWCGKRNNAHSNLDFREANRPAPGALSICASCHGVGVFELGRGGLALRRPTAEEARSMLADRDFMAAVNRLLRGVRPPGGVAGVAGV